MDSCKYSELIFDRGAKKFNGRRMIFSTVSTRAVGHPQQPPPHLNLIFLIQKLKWIIDVNVKYKTFRRNRREFRT